MMSPKPLLEQTELHLLDYRKRRSNRPESCQYTLAARSPTDGRYPA